MMLLHSLQTIFQESHKYYLKYEKMVVFLFRLGILILAWKVAFHFVWHNDFLLAGYNNFSLIVIDMILHCCAFLLEFFQYEIEIDGANRILRLKNTIGVTVGEPCIGFDVSALFVALIISAKGAVTKKAWFIPLGVLLIYLLNLIRICALAILVTINQEMWELNHKLIFTVIIYSGIFLMWQYWLLKNK